MVAKGMAAGQDMVDMEATDTVVMVAMVAMDMEATAAMEITTRVDTMAVQHTEVNLETQITILQATDTSLQSIANRLTIHTERCTSSPKDGNSPADSTLTPSKDSENRLMIKF